MDLLLSGAAMGALYLLLLFGACFGGVVGFRWYSLRSREERERALREEWEREQERTPAPPPAPKAASPQKVYYIVEKKRTRSKAEYGEPREIHF